MQVDLEMEITLIITHFAEVLHLETQNIFAEMELEFQIAIENKRHEYTILLELTLHDLEVTFLMEIDHITLYWETVLGDALWYWEHWAVEQITAYEIEMNNYVVTSCGTIQIDYE